MHVNSSAWKLFGGSNQKFRGSIDAAQPEELKVENIFYTAKLMVVQICQKTSAVLNTSQ